MFQLIHVRIVAPETGSEHFLAFRAWSPTLAFRIPFPRRFGGLREYGDGSNATGIMWNIWLWVRERVLQIAYLYVIRHFRLPMSAVYLHYVRFDQKY
jgi:hypothetical protein